MTVWYTHTLSRWIVFAASLVSTGCVVNAVKPLDSTAPDLRSDHALVVLGITVKGSWPYSQFGVILDQYDVHTQRITGNCFSYNRIEAVVPATPTPTRFFAFDAPSGHYIFSAFNGSTLGQMEQAFQALPGHAVYIGNFVLGDSGIVTLRKDLAERQSLIAQALPHLPAALEMAAARTVAPAKPFMCTP